MCFISSGSSRREHTQPSKLGETRGHGRSPSHNVLWTGMIAFRVMDWHDSHLCLPACLPHHAGFLARCTVPRTLDDQWLAPAPLVLHYGTCQSSRYCRCPVLDRQCIVPTRAQRARLAHTRGVQAESLKQMKLGQLTSRVGIWVRELAISALPPSVLQKKLHAANVFDIDPWLKRFRAVKAKRTQLAQER